MCRRNDPALLLRFGGPPLTTPFYTLRCVNAPDRLKQAFRTSRVNIRRLTDVGLLLIQAVPLASRRWSNSNTRVNILPRWCSRPTVTEQTLIVDIRSKSRKAQTAKHPSCCYQARLMVSPSNISQTTLEPLSVLVSLSVCEQYSLRLTRNNDNDDDRGNDVGEDNNNNNGYGDNRHYYHKQKKHWAAIIHTPILITVNATLMGIVLP